MKNEMMKCNIPFICLGLYTWPHSRSSRSHDINDHDQVFCYVSDQESHTNLIWTFFFILLKYPIKPSNRYTSGCLLGPLIERNI